MGPSQVCGSVGLVAVLLFVACGDGESPVQPTPSVPAPPTQVFSLSGRVTDTAYRPVGGSRVEVTDGPRAGTVTTTDDAGRFSMPGSFTGMITVRASKDGHLPDARTVPLRPPASPVEGAGRWEVALYLEPLGPSANVAGVYTLTVTADSACSNLPAQARTRTYTATIVPGGRSSSFLATLSDARFLSGAPWCPGGHPPESCTYNQSGIGIAGDYASISVGMVEQLGEVGYLAVGAGAEGSFGPTGITGPLSGSLLYCPSEPTQIDQGTWACLASAGVECDSRNHQLTLIRR
jgi:Carboxypeptidase regulatory-like domain